jgi:hypothetical protein
VDNTVTFQDEHSRHSLNGDVIDQIPAKTFVVPAILSSSERIARCRDGPAFDHPSSKGASPFASSEARRPARSQPLGMAVSARTDAGAETALLRAYADDALARRCDRDAVVAAACRPGADTRAASAALAALKSDPPTDPRLLSALLTVAAGGARIDDIAVFVLATAAWKVVTAAVYAPFPAVQDVPLRKRILVSALTLSSAILRDICRMLSDIADLAPDAGRHQETVSAVTRFIKIVRFHCVNAARMAEHFMEQKIVMTASDACVSSALLNLASVLRATALQSDVMPSDVVDELETQALMPATAVTNAVLAMFETSSDVGESIVTALGVGECGGVDQAQLAGRLVAVAYLVRMGQVAAPPRPEPLIRPDNEPGEEGAGAVDRDAMETLQEPTSGATASAAATAGCAAFAANATAAPTASPGDDKIRGRSAASFRTGNWLRQAARPFILPLLLDLVGRTYATAFRVRLRVGGNTLASLAVAAVGSCAAQAADAFSDDDVDDPTTITVALLLEEVASRNPLVAYVAAEGCLALLQHLSPYSAKQMKFFCTVLAITRLALAADVSCAESQWVPLGARMAAYLLSVHRLRASDMFPLFPSPQRIDSVSGDGLDVINDRVLCDVAALRILAGLIHMVSQPDGRHESEQNQPSQILEDLGLPIDKLSGFAKAALLGNAQGGRVAEACVHLLPHVCDARSAAGAALACLKRPTCSTALVVSALNTLNPGSMPDASLRVFACEAPRVMHRHGPRIYPAIVALASRVVTDVHNSVPLTTWTALCQSIDTAVAFAKSVADGCITSPLDHLISAAIVHHASVILKVTGSGSSVNNTGTRAALPAASLPFAEDARQRASTFLVDAHSATSVSPQERLICSREADMVQDARLAALEEGANRGASPFALQEGATNMMSLAPTVAALARTVFRGAGSKGGCPLPVWLCGELDALLALVPILSSIAGVPPKHEQSCPQYQACHPS